jgi:hypothetical protein
MIYSRRQKSLSALQQEPHISWRIKHDWYRNGFDWDKENIHQAWNFSELELNSICNQLDRGTSPQKRTTVLLICELVGVQNCCHPILNNPGCQELPYILESNPHPFCSFRRLKIRCGLDSRSRAGFWKNGRAAVRAIDR